MKVSNNNNLISQITNQMKDIYQGGSSTYTPSGGAAAASTTQRGDPPRALSLAQTGRAGKLIRK